MLTSWHFDDSRENFRPFGCLRRTTRTTTRSVLIFEYYFQLVIQLGARSQSSNVNIPWEPTARPVVRSEWIKSQNTNLWLVNDDFRSARGHSIDVLCSAIVESSVETSDVMHLRDMRMSLYHFAFHLCFTLCSKYEWFPIVQFVFDYRCSNINWPPNSRSLRRCRWSICCPSRGPFQRDPTEYLLSLSLYFDIRVCREILAMCIPEQRARG